MSTPPSIKTILANSGLVTPADLAAAEARAVKERTSLLHAVELAKLVPEDQLLDVVSKGLQIPKANIHEMDIPRTILDLIPRDIATKHRVVPIDRAGNNIIVATGDPTNSAAMNAIRVVCGFFPKVVLVSEVRLSDALAKYYAARPGAPAGGAPGGPGAPGGGPGAAKPGGSSLGVAMPKKAPGSAPDKGQADRVDINANSGDGPIVKLVNQVMKECITRRASDIHIEPYETFVRIRLRVDGSLVEIARPPIDSLAALVSRVKIMAKINIAETRLPQDGAVQIVADGQPIDFRVNTCPAVFGEKVVLRILDKANLQTDMTRLGFEKDQLEQFQSAIHAPFGMVLVTGPTGSGKTTTLYSALAELNQESDNIMTAEDPVEYKLEGINQVQMKPDIGLNFAAALRAFLRQDPDIIMVGEIRDLETGEIAVKAALTGHMVLSTLHTNSAPETISRLMNMGIESFNLVSALACVTAQRLVRKICDKCRTVDESVTPQAMIELGIHPQYATRVKAYKGAGCQACGGSGNRGRIAVHEVLKMNDPVREAILRGEPALKIKRIAMSTGMRTLRQSALNKMVQGVCDVKEVLKKTASDADDSGGSAKGAA